VFLTTYICTINLLLLFDNRTGMTHLNMELLVCGLLASTKMEVMHVPATSTRQKLFQFARIVAGWTLDLA